MKNTHIKYIAIAVCGIMAACTQDKTDGPADRTPVNFTTGIATRAADGMWQDGDRIGIFMVAAGEQLSDESVIDKTYNRQYAATAGVSATLTPVSESEAIYFPLDGTVDFVAYYPYMEVSNYTTQEINVSDQSGGLAPDLLYSDNAKNRTKSDPDVELRFRHTMSKITVGITLLNEFDGENVASVKISDLAAKGMLHLDSGQWSPTGDERNVTLYDTGGSVFAAHLIPDEAVSSNRMIIVAVGDKTYSCPLPDSAEFAAGTAYTWNLTVGRDGIVDAGFTITDWEGAALPDGSVEVEIADRQIEIVWGGYNDADFTGVEIFSEDGKTYASEVAPNTDGTASTTTGLLTYIPDDLVIKTMWVYYMGRKLEIPDGNFAFADGVLTIENFHIITKREHLEYINSSDEALAGSYTQICDIDLGGSASPWTPIGNIEHKFTGVYDGGGYKIENIYVDLGSNDDGTSDGAGLFGYCQNSTLSNIHIASGSVAGRHKVGGVCGWSSGEIALCSNSAAITGNDNVGGVCGENNHGTISWCSNTGNVSGNYQVGGVCGRNYGTVSGCYNSGEVKGNDNKVGGVCGDNNDTVSGCYNTGNVSGNDEVGGVCGENNDTVSGCYNTGNVSGNREVGGVCGRLYGQEEAAPDDPEFVFNPAKLIECYSAAAVTGTGEVGGVCGQILTNDNYPDDKGEIIHCFWGVGIGVGTSPEKAVGGGDAADGSTYYEFSDTNWPTTTGDYWKLFSNGGVWESLGAWGGSPINSTYPVLSSFR